MPTEITQYMWADWRRDMPLLEFLRKSNAKGQIAQYLRRRLGCRWGDCSRPLLGAAPATADAAPAPLAAAAGLFGHLDVGAATLAAILAAFGWCAALVLGRHPVGDELRHLAGTAWARARPAVPTFRNAPGWRS